jgi:hypothetical protein
MKRREFINNTLAMTSLSLIPSWAFTQEAEPQFFLQVYMGEGWDTTLATEAWNFQTQPDEKKIFIEYSANDTIPFGATYVGPAMAGVKKYFPKMTIFNGVIMSSIEVGHTSPQTFATTGISDGTEPNFSCLFTDHFYKGKGSSILSNTSVATAGRIYKVATLDNVKNLSGFASSSSMGNAATSRGLIANAYKDLGVTSQKLVKVGAEYKDSLDKVTEKDVQLLAKGYLSGLYPSAYIRMNRSMDSHNNHVNQHKKNLKENFDDLAKYLDGLSSIQWKNSGKSLLDLTTVVVTSDFTRTPALNVSGGKDHNPFSNSMIVISSKFKSEVIVGRSRLLEPEYSPIGVSTLLAMPVDVVDLSPKIVDAGTQMITPSVIYGSLLDVHGKINDSTPEALRKAFKLKPLYK